MYVQRPTDKNNFEPTSTNDVIRTILTIIVIIRYIISDIIKILCVVIKIILRTAHGQVIKITLNQHELGISLELS